MVFRLSNLGGKLGGFLIGFEEHIEHKRKNCNSGDKSNDVEVAGEGAAELVYHEGDCISKSALITDCEPGPFCVVHFTLHSADCCEARCAEKVEYEEGIAGDSVEGSCKVLVNSTVAAAIEDTESTDDVLFCDKSGDGGDSCLPVAPAERDEYPGDGRADLASSDSSS